MTTKEGILSSVRDFWNERPLEQFVPGETYIPTSGKILDSDDICSMVDAVLDGWLTDGPFADQFEREILEVQNHAPRWAAICNSGSSANLLAVAAITADEFGSRAAKPGDEVITVACGFPTTLNPILHYGLTPVFVDVCLPTYLPDIKEVEQAINPATKAIFIPHTLGNPFDLEAYKEMADDAGIWLLSDCCDAFGAESNGHKVGTIEDISTLSFYVAHQMTCAEGGAVLSISPLLDKVVRSFRDWGRACWCKTGKDNTCGKRFSHQYESLPFGYDHKYVYKRRGFNFKMTDVQAALGVSQIRKLPQFIAKRRHNFQYLRTRMEKFSKYFVLPEAEKNSNPSWFGFCLTLQKGVNFTRLDLIKHLEAHKIGTRLLFGGNLLLHPAYKGIHKRIFGRLDNSDMISKETFWIGCYQNITDEMMDYILNIFDIFIRAHQRV